jgi:crotonobetainyl-CoA:carnitine CoA-transferase CaiB-like acyl-CoA transferase
MLPLEGFRIVEIGTVLMAPYAAQWLADFGADVIKVEPPEGDQTRHIGPAREAGMAAMFLSLNRNKRSVAIDIKDPRGREELEGLLGSAHALIHNIRPHKLALLELDAASVMARHPHLVHASLAGYAAGGPYAGRPAYDDVIQGMTGVADLVRRQTGDLRYAPMALADKTCGIVAALAVCAALIRSGQTGIGSAIEVPMFETMVAFNLVENFSGGHFANERGAMGYGRTLAGSRGPFATRDGHISFMPYTDRQWRVFFEATDRHDLLDDPRFTDIARRTENIDALYAILTAILRERTSGEWLQLAEREEIPAGAVLALEDLVSDPQLAGRGFFAEAVDSAMGDMRFAGVPVTFDGEAPPVRMPPRLDEHREEVLAGLSTAHRPGGRPAQG